jgi:aspartate racemase
MPQRVLGILGGMGPEATVDLYREILACTPAQRDQDHFPVLIYSYPCIPDRSRAILEGGEDPLPYLVEAARVLERGGARMIAIPCNTAHYFLPQLRQRIQLPILDMITETLAALRRRLPDIRTAGLLAATGTVRSGIYDRTFAQQGLRIIAPADPDQLRVAAAVAQVKAGAHNRATREMLQSLGGSLVEAGADAVILGCTEIPLAFHERGVPYTTVNPTRELARAAVAWARGERD